MVLRNLHHVPTLPVAEHWKGTQSLCRDSNSEKMPLQGQRTFFLLEPQQHSEIPGISYRMVKMLIPIFSTEKENDGCCMKLSSFLLVEQQMVQLCIVIPINQWAKYRLKFPWSGSSFSAFIYELDTKTFLSSTFDPTGSFLRTVWKYNAYSWPFCFICLYWETLL